MVYTVDMIYAVEMVYTVDTTITVDTAKTVGTVELLTLLPQNCILARRSSIGLAGHSPELV